MPPCHTRSGRGGAGRDGARAGESWKVAPPPPACPMSSSAHSHRGESRPSVPVPPAPTPAGAVRVVMS
ncbi:hypothetical protein E2C01_002388 [Portunus trituberculatus]|uniref:Uncharacterized protein n=1 Tax=Portunus trituberculatus TaxID=210409 RepID=A0A5B7CK93_PORTR|nr:hypothetical protein [Portunus trituberculatus]